MPYTWTEPEVFLVLNEELDHVIYHAYKDGYDDHMLSYWYNASVCEDPTFQFDIRELQEWKDAPNREDHEAILKRAYANRNLKFEGGYPEDDGERAEGEAGESA